MSVRVAVRCRPFNQRERDLHSDLVISMNDTTTTLAGVDNEGRPLNRQFTFDHSFWSNNPADAHFATQADVYKHIGTEVLTNALEGYNACVFAYGQTGSGKSYTMMGNGDGDDRGIIPRLCEDLFAQVTAREVDDSSWNARIEVSYLEIYLERVRDLLGTEEVGRLRVREHSSTGPYVENLTSHAVTNFENIKSLMEEGNKMRTVRSTAMNDVSSRSHAIFQIVVKQTQTQTNSGETVKLERVSKISLVDLAGSERSGQINAGKSDRMKEGNVINKSLSTLGKVISTLAERSNKSGRHHIPYRESVLTWLLKESLGGNSKTIMMATVSPAGANAEESLSTLRYASQAKNIVNKAVVNEDHTATMLRQLNEEIESLRAQLASTRRGSNTSDTSDASDRSQRDAEWEASIKLQLAESEKLMTELTRTWEDKLERTLEMQATRMHDLRAHGILVDEEDEDGTPVGVMAPTSTPYLINLHHNPMHEQQCLVYYLREGVTLVGRRDQDATTIDPIARLIELQGTEILPEHCEFHCVHEDEEMMTIVFIVPLEGAMVKVNKQPIFDITRLKSGDIVQLSRHNVFRFDNPEEFALSPASSAAPSIPASPSMTPRSAYAHQWMTGNASVGDITPNVSVIASGEERPSPVGALNESDDLEISRMEAQLDAMFPYALGDEEDLLTALIPDCDPRNTSFKLLPAYGVYLIVRFCQAEHGSKALSALILKAATLMKMALYSAHGSRDLASLAFWLANGSELLFVLRSDYSLASCHTAEAQLLLTDAVQEAFDTLLQEIKARVAPALPAIMTETASMIGAAPPKSANNRRKKAAVEFDVAFIVESLKAVYRLVRNAMVSPAIVNQLFAHAFYFIGASLFNTLVQNRTYFNWQTGMNIRFNLTRLTEWTAARGITANVEQYLTHITQAAMLLQGNKSSLAHLDALCECCDRLNSLQIDKILRSYKPARDESPVPGTLIECMKARAMNGADRLDAEDDSVECRLTLLRNASFALPFRLSGEFHMNSGLLDKDIVDEVKEFLSNVEIQPHVANESRVLTLNTTCNQSIMSSCSKMDANNTLEASQWAALSDFQSPPPTRKVASRSKIAAFFGF
eukprot:m.14481 g.14481  ORF g.14481 m.14481 type:complete len:1097 (+) comp3373_c0_seq1:389-3679(+)